MRSLSIKVILILSFLLKAITFAQACGANTDEQLIVDLVLEEKSAVGFHEQAVPSDVLQKILKAVTPYVSLSKWKLIVIEEKSNRIKVLETMQKGFLKLGRDRLAKIMERWKTAPLIFVFCMPKGIGAFGGLPSEIVRPQALVELGMGVQSLALVARVFGVETHWIAGALLINKEIKEVLKIPEEYDVGFFGIAGFPSEEIMQEFPQLQEIFYAESWKESFR